eukprot:230477_1
MFSMIIFLFSESYQFCATKDDNIHICSVYTEHPLQNIGGLAIITMSVFDLLYSTLTLFFFVYKLKRLIESQIQIAVNEQYVNEQYDNNKYELMMDDNDNHSLHSFKGKQRLNKLLAISLKCCVLCSVTVISNWLFVFVGLTFVFNLGWFICIDCLINGICVYLLYQFNDKIYHRICCPVIILWKVMVKCLGFTDDKLYKNQMQKVIINSNRVPLSTIPH